jgi:hypothetical protein
MNCYDLVLHRDWCPLIENCPCPLFVSAQTLWQEWPLPFASFLSKNFGRNVPEVIVFVLAKWGARGLSSSALLILFRLDKQQSASFCVYVPMLTAD